MADNGLENGNMQQKIRYFVWYIILNNIPRGITAADYTRHFYE